ncbi:MAG: fluoride efflux transporter CrcB [Flavobacteriaceae bacterium]|nr:fluoride efflux transporter CrcB [Flavobacteriaceae bacterium]
MKAILFIFIGGGLGSVARYVLSKFNFINAIPYGTLIANILGCFLTGLILAYINKNNGFSKELFLLLATGFCGGFTTFSTFAYENQNFLKSGDYSSFILYTALSFILGLLAVTAGLALIKN